MAKRSSVPTRRVLLPKTETPTDRIRALLLELEAIAAQLARITLHVSVWPEAPRPE